MLTLAGAVKPLPSIVTGTLRAPWASVVRESELIAGAGGTVRHPLQLVLTPLSLTVRS